MIKLSNLLQNIKEFGVRIGERMPSLLKYPFATVFIPLHCIVVSQLIADLVVGLGIIASVLFFTKVFAVPQVIFIVTVLYHLSCLALYPFFLGLAETSKNVIGNTLKGYGYACLLLLLTWLMLPLF